MVKDSYFMSLFQPHIWQRGGYIADSEDIKIFHQSINEIRGIVRGTQLYDVCIKFEEGIITHMECTCPYAEKGENCKHMAAVLLKQIEYLTSSNEEKWTNGSAGDFEIDLETQPVTAIQYDKQLQAIKMLLDKLSKEEINSFALQLIMDNQSVKKRFLSSFYPKTITCEGMVSEFELICDSYLSKNGFINYNYVNDFFHEIDSVLDQISELISKGELWTAAKAIIKITDGFDDMPFDDSGDASSGFYNQVIEIVDNILLEDNEELNEHLYKWMGEVIDSGRDWRMAEILYPLWSENFTESELVDIEISRIMNRWKLPVKIWGDDISYDLSSDLVDLANLMAKRGDEDAEIEKILFPFKNSTRVIDWLINRALENNDTKAEFSLIKEGLAQNKKNLFVAQNYRIKLCRYYQRNKYFEDYKRTLKEIIIKGGDFEYYLEYKSLYNNVDWPELAAAIIEKITSGPNSYYRDGSLMEIYNEEGMYKELLELVTRQGIDYLGKYEEALIEYDSRKVLDLYLRHLDRMVSLPADVKRYPGIVRLMEHVKTLPGGAQMMKQRSLYYKEKYKARKRFVSLIDGVEW